MEFSRPEYWSGWPSPSPGDLPNPGIEPRSLTLQADSLPAEPQGKPKNTGVGSLSHPIPSPGGIFPTQESNRGLLHCRRILYQLSYEGSLIAGGWGPLLKGTHAIEGDLVEFTHCCVSARNTLTCHVNREMYTWKTNNWSASSGVQPHATPHGRDGS